MRMPSKSTYIYKIISLLYANRCGMTKEELLSRIVLSTHDSKIRKTVYASIYSGVRNCSIIEEKGIYKLSELGLKMLNDNEGFQSQNKLIVNQSEEPKRSIATSRIKPFREWSGKFDFWNERCERRTFTMCKSDVPFMKFSEK